MARRVARLTLDTLADLPDEVRQCLAWELHPVCRDRVARAVEAGDADAAAAEKEAWLSRVLLEWGSCGRVVYVDGDAAGFILYAPPWYFPGSASLPTAPVGDDAVQLATAQVFEEYAGSGLGRLLMQEMVKDLLTRGGIRAVEAFGRHGVSAAAGPPTGTLGPLGAVDPCLLPAEFLQRVGFGTQRPHPRTPRMRLDLRSVLSWRDEVEAALERLLGAVRPVRARPGPVQGAYRSDLPPGPLS